MRVSPDDLKERLKRTFVDFRRPGEIGPDPAPVNPDGPAALARIEKLERLARLKAWKTRRERYGSRGHSGSYRRPPNNTGALMLVIDLMNEGVLSEGQVAAATGIDRVEIRRLADSQALSKAKEAAK